MTSIIRIAISASEPLFNKGLEFVFQDFKDFDPVFLSSEPTKLLGELALLKSYDLILLDFGYLDIKLLFLDTDSLFIDSKKTIILSGHSKDGDVKKILESKDIALLPRSVEPDGLMHTLRQRYYKNTNYFSDQVPFPYPQKIPGKIDLSHISFTKREMEVLQFICDQYTTSEIADELYISPRTVDGHRNNLLEKTNSKNTAGLVVFALKNQIVDVDEQKKRG